ncbi:placenta growth factor [Cricetulus griseus]|uniref:Placenta growth factor n=1 Tax=Cricetulus griseus TaxID=10029 RepID=G3HFQ6_CRIGR|nr:placenta growth factor [Cricetulus griseus]XP_027274338.1 placenta growth factor [Cricetulus griseus]EGW02789.1 Placenta growth factor [Cricetulus griseus]ERE73507.1 placenta growth factor-like protein [Cricetulus griseus]
MLAMKLFTCFLQVLAGLAVHSQGTLSAGNNSTEVEVVPFNEVWGRSYCRPMEKLVEIVDEYPDEVAHIFSPSCVPLTRCTGCCGDESLQCVPIKTANITMQILKIPVIRDQHSYVEMTFSQDVLCECRPIQEKTKSERRKIKGKRKREKQKSTD